MISFAKLMRQILTERISFRSLLGGSESGRKERGRTDVNPRSSEVTSTDTGEAWTFNYKSDPSTTGQRWHGFIQFLKEDVSVKDSAMDLDCMVDCDCPDYRFRYAYNNKQADVGWTGKHDGWKYNNQNNGQKWKPRSQGGVGDYGVGLCKHLCYLAEFLKTSINPVAPQPEDEPPQVAKPELKPSKPASQQPQTSTAPKPEDSYSDSQSGSDTLQEQQSQLYGRMNTFVKTHPQFLVQYEEESN